MSWNRAWGKLDREPKTKFQPYDVRIPALAGYRLPWYEDHHPRLIRELCESRAQWSSSGLSRRGRKNPVDMLAGASRGPASEPDKSSIRPALADKSPGVSRKVRGKKKGKTGKKRRVKKGLAGSEVTKKGDTAVMKEEQQQISARMFSDPFSSEGYSPRPNIEDPTLREKFLKAHALLGWKAALSLFSIKSSIKDLTKVRGSRRRRALSVQDTPAANGHRWKPKAPTAVGKAWSVAHDKQGLEDRCKSLEVLFFPKADAGHRDTKHTPNPVSQGLSQGLPSGAEKKGGEKSRSTKKAGPRKQNKLEATNHERNKGPIELRKSAEDSGHLVLRPIVEQEGEESAHRLEAAQSPWPECQAAVTAIKENCGAQFQVPAIRKGSISKQSDPVGSRANAQGARRKGSKVTTSSMERGFMVPRYSPRPNEQPKDVKSKVSGKRNILSSLSNVNMQLHNQSSHPGRSRARRATTKETAAAAVCKENTPKPNAPPKTVKGAQEDSGASTYKKMQKKGGQAASCASTNKKKKERVKGPRTASRDCVL